MTLPVVDLSLFAGMILSFFFEYVPGFSDWYAKKTPQEKRLLMLGFTSLAGIGSYLAACYVPGTFGISCDQTGMWAILRAILLSIVSNQSTHRLTKRS